MASSLGGGYGAKSGPQGGAEGECRGVLKPTQEPSGFCLLKHPPPCGASSSMETWCGLSHLPQASWVRVFWVWATLPFLSLREKGQSPKARTHNQASGQ